MRRERTTIVVFTEGEGTEPDYLGALRRLTEIRERTALQIELDPRHGVPLTLVQLAVRRLADPEVDECWCVFDVEAPLPHPHLREAVALAEREGVRLAVSNPCFELWLLLHFGDHSAYLTTDDAERRSRRADGRSGKRLDPTLYVERREVAADRAARLAARHAGNGTDFPADNPSSGMYRLVRELEG